MGKPIKEIDKYVQIQYTNVLDAAQTLFQVCEIDGVHAKPNGKKQKHMNVYLTLKVSATPGVHGSWGKHYGAFVNVLLAKHWNMGRVYYNKDEESISINLCDPVPSAQVCNTTTFSA